MSTLRFGVEQAFGLFANTRRAGTILLRSRPSSPNAPDAFGRLPGASLFATNDGVDLFYQFDSPYFSGRPHEITPKQKEPHFCDSTLHV